MSGLPDDELFRTFNMGVGLVVVCAPPDEAALRAAIKEPLFLLATLPPDRAKYAWSEGRGLAKRPRSFNLQRL